MKRYLAIFGILFIGVIAGLIVRGIPIVLQVNAGGGIQADRNGDVNGDARLDMSDAVYLLLHIFRDGPQPVAFAQGLPDNAEQLLEEIANPCKERPGRFLATGDGTVTDNCTGLMWMATTADTNGDGRIETDVNRFGAADRDTLSWDEARQYCENLEFAGYGNWRLPTLEELFSLHWTEGPASTVTGVYPPIVPTSQTWNMFHWTSTESAYDSAKVWTWRPQGARPQAGENPKDRSSGALFLPVRDTGPNE